MADVRTTLEAALRAIHDPRTPSETRREAQAFASAFTQRPDSVTLAVELFRLHTQQAAQHHASNNPAAVVECDSFRHFALHVLQRRVRSSWDELTDAMRGELKALSLSIITEGMRDVANEANFVKEKAVALVADVAEREWPQRWPELTQHVTALASASPAQSELVLKVLAVLAEDCTNSEFNDALPAERRSDILQELNALVPTLLPLFRALLGRSFGALQQRQAAINQQQQQALSVSAARELQGHWAVAVSAMRALECFLAWVPLKYVFECNFLEVFTTLLAVNLSGVEVKRLGEDLQLTTSNCIGVLATRKPGDFKRHANSAYLICRCLLDALDRIPMPADLPLVALDAPMCFWPQHCTSQHARQLEQVRPLHDSLTRALSALAQGPCALLVSTLGKAEKTSQQAETSAKVHTAIQVLDALMRMASHPSMAVRLSAMQAIVPFLRALPSRSIDPSNCQLSALDQALDQRFPLLLRITADNLIKVGQPSLSDNDAYEHPAYLFASDDYEDDDEFELAFGVLCGGTTTILRILSARVPHLTLHVLRCRVQLACTNVGPPPSNMLVGGERAWLQYPLNAPRVLLDRVSGTSSMVSPVTLFATATFVPTLESIMNTVPQCVMVEFGGESNGGGGGNTSLSQAEMKGAASELHALAAFVVKFDTHDALLLTRQLQAFNRLQRCFAAGPQGISLFGVVLEKLFNSVTFRNAQETAQNVQAGLLHPDTIGARKRACASMVDIFRGLSREGGPNSNPAMRTMMTSHLPTLCQRVLGMIRSSESGGVRTSEKLLLYEMLVTVSNTLGDLSKQSSFLDDVLSESLGIITSPQLIQRLSGAMGLRSLLGTDRLQDSDVVPVHALKRPQKEQMPSAKAGSDPPASPSEDARVLKAALSTIISIAKTSRFDGEDSGGVVFPFARHWPTVLPVLLHITAALHACWAPEFRQMMCKSRNADMGMLMQHPEEVRIAVGRSEYDEWTCDMAAGCECFPRKCSLEATSMWMSGLRELLYSGVTVAAWQSQGGDKQGIFYLSNISEMLSASVLSGLEWMEHRHLRKLLSNMLAPFSQSCPADRRTAVLFPCLKVAISTTLARLNDVWPTIKPDRNKSDMSVTSIKHREWLPVLLRVPPSDSDTVGLGGGAAGVGGDSAAASASGAGDNGGRVPGSAELLHDIDVRFVSRAFAEFLGTILALASASSPGGPATNAVANSNTQPQQHAQLTVPPVSRVQYLLPRDGASLSDLAAGVLSDPQMAEASLVGLVECMKCPDAVTAEKAVVTLSNLVPFLIVENSTATFVVRMLFPQVLETLLMPMSRLNALTEQNMITIVKDVYIEAVMGMSPSLFLQFVAQRVKNADNGASNAPPTPKAGLVDTVRATLLSVPGITNERLAKLDAALLMQHTDKAYKNLVKEMLGDSSYAIKEAKLKSGAGSDAGDLFGEIFQRKRPQVSNLPKALRHSGDGGGAGDVAGLGGLFEDD